MALVSALVLSGCAADPGPRAGGLVGSAGVTGGEGASTAPGGEVEVRRATGPAVELRGAEEVPGPGHPEAHGTAAISLVGERKEVCLELAVSGLDQPTAVHLHKAPAGGAGDVVLALPAPVAGDADVSACVSASAELLDRLRRHPGRFYVNVHSEAHPEGALRGQLR